MPCLPTPPDPTIAILKCGECMRETRFPDYYAMNVDEITCQHCTHGHYHGPLSAYNPPSNPGPLVCTTCCVYLFDATYVCWACNETAFALGTVADISAAQCENCEKPTDSSSRLEWEVGMAKMAISNTMSIMSWNEVAWLDRNKGRLAGRDLMQVVAEEAKITTEIVRTFEIDGTSEMYVNGRLFHPFLSQIPGYVITA